MIVAACQGVTIVAGIASKCPFDTWWPHRLRITAGPEPIHLAV